MKNKLFLIPLLLSCFLISCEKETSTEPEGNGTEEYGTIIIYSNPAGYEIIYDDLITGETTPDTLRGIEPGSHEIGLTHSVYLDTALTVTITGEETKTVNVNMELSSNFYGSIECTSVPPNALVCLNDSSTGKYTPVQLTHVYPGDIELKLMNDGCKTDSVMIQLKSSENLTVNRNLTDTLVWKNYRTDNSGMPSNKTTAVICNFDGDREMWIGTEDAGLVHFDFSVWEVIDMSNSVLPSNNITCLNYDDYGKVWVGTDNGLAVYDGSTFEIYTTENSILVDDFITSIQSEYADFEGAFVGTKSGGVLHISMSGECTLYNKDNSGLFSNSINDISLGENPLGIATDNGIFYDSRKDLNNLNCVYNSANTDIPGDNIIKVASQSFLYYYETGSNWVRRFWLVIDMGAADNLTVSLFEISNYFGESCTSVNFNGVVNHIYSINTEEAWLCTSVGLLKYNLLQEIERYNMSNSGLESNNVLDVASDTQQRIWIATDNGLVRYNPN